MTRILVIHGPNLNLLGRREPEIYGHATLSEIDDAMRRRSANAGVDLDIVQENGEGEIIGHIQGAAGRYDAIVINPASYSHTSLAIRDAIAAVGVPTVEVHLSNIHARESFRHVCMTAGACIGQICGLGPDSYLLGLDAAIAVSRRRGASPAPARDDHTEPTSE